MDVHTCIYIFHNVNSLSPCISHAVAAQVMSKSHKLVKAPLQLQFARQEKKKVEEFKRNQLAVHGLPEGVKKTFYEVVIAGCLEMEEEDDFELEVFDSSAIITFTKDYSTEGMYIHRAHRHPP